MESLEFVFYSKTILGELQNKMAAAAQNINNMTIRSILLAEKLTGSNFTNWYCNIRIVLRYEKNMKFVELSIGPAPDTETADPDTINKYYESVNLEQEVACIMLSIKAFHAYKQETRSVSKLLSLEDEKLLGHFGTPRLWQQSGRSEGSRVSSQTLTSKHMDWFTAGLDVPTAKLFLIPTGKLMVPAGSSWFLLVVPAGRLCGSYWSAYGFTHAMLKIHEKGIPKKAETPAVLAMREGKIQKDRKKPQGAKGLYLPPLQGGWSVEEELSVLPCRVKEEKEC
ncbi:hypothetical protein Tco_0644653 [Tanacetum coccineum]